MSYQRWFEKFLEQGVLITVAVINQHDLQKRKLKLRSLKIKTNFYENSGNNRKNVVLNANILKF